MFPGMKVLASVPIVSTGCDPFMINGLCHCYHLGELTVFIRGIRSDFQFLYHFS